MNVNVDNRLGESTNKLEVIKGINEMLECLLSERNSGCIKCKQCEKVDACCFLTDSVFVYKNISKINK